MIGDEGKTAVVAVEVDCPQCGNANRAARRRCTYCGKTGHVLKYVPVSPAPEGEA